MDDVAVGVLVFADGMKRFEAELLGKDELTGPMAKFQRQENGGGALRLVNELAAAAEDEIQPAGNLLGKGETGRGGGQVKEKLGVKG